MKIKIDMTVEVDPDAWALEWGIASDAATVREDVRDYVLDMTWVGAASIVSATRIR